MVDMDDRFMNHSVGWIVEYTDGTTVYEGELSWNKVVKRNIAALHLKWHDRMWSVKGKENYVQFKRGFVTLSPNGNFSGDSMLSERCIGFYDEKGRKIIYKVNNQTGKMTIEVRDG